MQVAAPTREQHSLDATNLALNSRGHRIRGPPVQIESFFFYDPYLHIQAKAISLCPLRNSTEENTSCSIRDSSF